MSCRKRNVCEYWLGDGGCMTCPFAECPHEKNVSIQTVPQQDVDVFGEDPEYCVDNPIYDSNLFGMLSCAN